jgi:hypothetical protein
MEQPVGVKTYRQEEYGLRLPNGEELWPPEQFHGRDFATVEEREIIFRSVLSSEENLYLNTQELLNRFQWLKRYATVTVVYEALHMAVPLDDTGRIEPPVAVLDESIPPGAGEDPEPNSHAEYAPGMSTYQ